MDDRMKLRDRIERDGITAEAKWTEKPAWADFGANWYKVTLRNGNRKMTVPFGMGEALTREPTAEEVLDVLISDSSGADNARSFEEWADEFGLDTDSRKAHRSWKQVCEHRDSLILFLGDDYAAYLYETEGL